MKVIDKLQIENIAFEVDRIIVIINGQVHCWNLGEISQRLLNAADEDRNLYMISPSGYGIHWPSIDEDISLRGLLNNKHKLKQI